MLPWAIAPLVFCVIAIVRQRTWWQLLLLIPASVPVRRSFDEWRANGADVRNGGVCFQVLQINAPYAEECRVVCDAQRASSHFNPGVLEAECRRFAE